MRLFAIVCIAGIASGCATGWKMTCESECGEDKSECACESSGKLDPQHEREKKE